MTKIFNVGYNGTEKYGKKVYNCWNSMLRRCYSEKYQKNKPTYIGCFVSNDMLNFLKFKDWYFDNYYDIPEEIICLDKDILVQGNKEYNFNKCIFVPNLINSLLVSHDLRNSKYKKGVFYMNDSRNKPFRAHLSMYKKQKNIGSFCTEIEAHNAYLKAKKEYSIEVVNTYKNKIPEPHYTKIYNAILKYDFSKEMHEQGGKK